MFLVNAGQQGSRVGVIEGEVRVREGDAGNALRPGEQVATSPTMARALGDRGHHLEPQRRRAPGDLDSFMKGMAQTAGPLTAAGAAGGRQRRADAPVQAAALEFEEASIRPCDPGQPACGYRRARAVAARTAST